MGSCQSSSNSSAVENERKKNMDDATIIKRDEEKYCYNDDSVVKPKNNNNNNNNNNNGNGNGNGNNNNNNNNNNNGSGSGKNSLDRSNSSNRSSRHDKVLEWKNTLHDDGDLAQAVVLIETSLTKRVEDIYDGVHDGPILGSGAAGIVRKCKHRETGFEFAVKCLNVGIIENDAIIDTLKEEIFIMCQADHPDILRLEEVYESNTQIYLIEDLSMGGDMFDRLEEQPEYHFSEIQCAKIVKQMMNSIRYLHSKKVIHRDLKLENFLFDDEESDSIRLIDFGLSKHFNHDGYKHNDAVGTPYTIAPEMIKGEYDEKVDVWALGVITYLLLSGDPPFGGMDGEALLTVRQNILDCNLKFEPNDIWDNISDTAKKFVSRLLTEDPNERPSAAEAQKDEWLTVCANMDPTQSAPLNTKLINNLLAFKDFSNLHKILLEVVSFTLLPGQIKGLKSEFEKIDRDGRGEITLDDLKEVLLNRVETGNLGSLTTEDDVEAIFDSLRLKKTETTIHWHEFIAAAVSRADYDNRNLRLAFNRFDHSGKGYISIDDIRDLISTKTGSMDKDIMDMWMDGMKSCECSKDKDKMYFEDFEEVMKGRQKRRSSLVDGLRRSGSVRNYSSRSLLPLAAKRDSKSTGQLQTSIRSSGLLNERLSSSHILTSTLAMSSSLRDVMKDSAIDETKSGEGGGAVAMGTTSSATARGSLTRSSAGSSTRSSSGGAFLTASRRKLLTPVSEKSQYIAST